MKIRYGLLMAGVCALALSACNTTHYNSTALLSSGTLDTDNGHVLTVSNATTDELTKANVKYNDNGTPDDTSDDSVRISVKGGGTVKGPTDYVVNPDLGDSGVIEETDGYTFVALKPKNSADDEDNNILVAGVGSGDSWVGFVGANDTDGSGNLAAGFGGTKPTGPTPTGTVTYNGAAAAAVQTTGSTGAIIGGTSTVAANFTSGAVNGTMNFSGTSNDVGFTGTMATDKASYTADTVTLGGAAATGQALGGFYGPGYEETAGAFDVQAGTTKVVGSFGGTAATP